LVVFALFYLFMGYPNAPLDASVRSVNNKFYPLLIFKRSADNLSRDEHLRDQMNDEGWVPVRVIAAFRRVSSFPSSILKLTCVNHFTMSTAESISYCIKVLLIVVVFVCLRDLGISSLSLLSVLVVEKE